VSPTVMVKLPAELLPLSSVACSSRVHAQAKVEPKPECRSPSGSVHDVRRRGDKVATAPAGLVASRSGWPGCQDRGDGVPNRDGEAAGPTLHSLGAVQFTVVVPSGRCSRSREADDLGVRSTIVRRRGDEVATAPADRRLQVMLAGTVRIGSVCPPPDGEAPLSLLP